MTLFNNIIFTPRLSLRRLRMEDLELLTYWSNNGDSHGEYLTPEYMTESECRDKLESGITWTEKRKCFMIEFQDETPIGTIHYWLRPEREECAVIKIRIAEPGKRGKGFGTEAQKYIIISLFERMKVSEIEMYTDINNKTQQRCLTKLGFDLIESLTYEDHQVTRHGNLYRLTSDRFKHYPLYQYHYE